MPHLRVFFHVQPPKESTMSRALRIVILSFLAAATASAQTADEIVTKYLKTIVGMDQVEGTDALKLKVTLANGDVFQYYMDTDYYVPIKIDIKRMIRGAEREYETVLGDYKEVAGWYLPHSFETNVKGSQDKQKVVFEKIEANVALDDKRFEMPLVNQPTKEKPADIDASKKLPKKPSSEPTGEKKPKSQPEA